jgi:hypothetical protein
VLSNDRDESYFASSAGVLDILHVAIRRVISSAAMRSGQKQDRDGDCGDYNKQRIDAALRGGSVRVGFWGHGGFGGMGLRGVFWGSGEVFKENLKNWQGNFFEIATFFCEKRKCLGVVPLRGEKSRVTATSGHMNSRFCGKKSRKKLKCPSRELLILGYPLMVCSRSWEPVGQALPLAGMAPEEFEEQLDIGVVPLNLGTRQSSSLRDTAMHKCCRAGIPAC